ncbi:MAG: N-acetylmuramoyl-L-alanine amidase [Chakrabartia sp.]
MNYKPLTRIDYIAIHCSATPATMDIGAAEIRQWHRAKGWRDIGYHFVIRRDGRVEPGRDVNIPGAHEPRINAFSLAVCMVGGSPKVGSPEYKAGKGEDNFTPQQWASLKTLVTSLHAKHPAAKIIGHRDVPGVAKACPSFDVRTWWAANQPNQ